MKIFAFIKDPCEVRRYLMGTGESTETPPFAPARASPTLELFGDDYLDTDAQYAQDATYQDMDEIQTHPEELNAIPIATPEEPAPSHEL